VIRADLRFFPFESKRAMLVLVYFVAIIELAMQHFSPPFEKGVLDRLLRSPVHGPRNLEKLMHWVSVVDVVVVTEKRTGSTQFS
jgi:hypothetical protein